VFLTRQTIQIEGHALTLVEVKDEYAPSYVQVYMPDKLGVSALVGWIDRKGRVEVDKDRYDRFHGTTLGKRKVWLEQIARGIVWDEPAPKARRSGRRKAPRAVGAGRRRHRARRVGEDDYRGVHRAPGREGAPLHDLTANGVYPDDVYAPSGPRIYGLGSFEDAGAWSIVAASRGKPSRKVRVYRAVPKASSHAPEIRRLEADKASILRRGRLPPSRQRE
jgi:hypothetical protein